MADGSSNGGNGQMTDASVSPLTALRDRDGGLPWTPKARSVWSGAKLLSTALLISWLIGWPFGSTLAEYQTTGTFNFQFGYALEILVLALTTAALVRGGGYALSLALRLEASVQDLASGSAYTGSHPSAAAARDQITALNAEIDSALSRLSEAESLIRQQVRAIDSAGNAIEEGTAKSTKALERERRALMELTEEMNKEAERFAEQIVARSRQATDDQQSIELRLAAKEEELDAQLKRLESVSERSLDRFEQLASAMETRSDSLHSAHNESASGQQEITDRIEANAERIKAAQDELAAQSQRLEELMRDQRNRADRLAKVIADQLQRAADASQPAELPTPPAPAAPQTPVAERPKPRTAAAPSNQNGGAAPRPQPPRQPRPPQVQRTPSPVAPAPQEAARGSSWKDILANVEANGEKTESAPKSAAPTPPAPRPNGATSAPAAERPSLPKTEPKPTPPTPAERARNSALEAARELARQEEERRKQRLAESSRIEVRATPADPMDRLMIRVQNFSLAMRTQLLGGPNHEELDRFEAGERHLFAQQILDQDPDDLRAAVANELETNGVFKERTSEFLHDFDTLLEPLSTQANGAEAIERHLKAPLGRLYIAVGAATGHFD